MLRLIAIVAVSSLLAAQEVQPAAAKLDFQKQIAPILLERCVECHGPKVQKGDLRLDAREHLFAGDQEEWNVLPGKPDDSELLRRIGLPVGDDDIMPEKGEPLRKDQQALIRQWIAEGAEWPVAVDKWFATAIAAKVIPKITFELPKVDAEEQAAIDAAVAELKKRGAVVQQVAADTPAIDVNLSLLRDKVTDADLALLVPLQKRLVWLNVSRTAISDDGRQHLQKLTQLRRLHAANTQLGDATFTALVALQHLEYVNAYATGLGDDGLAKLAELPKAARIYAWQSKVTPAAARTVRAAKPALALDLGDYVEERLAAAQKEIAERAERNKPVNDTCPVADKPIDPNQTVEHDGRRIAFCCGKCKAAFEKEPAKFLAKLPPKK
ncbi:MAG: hypothetical protein FJ301_14415 [Planctomycetes bacterium]|nr:hypothetical protein [Planctomycetota bacterium]